MGWGEKYALVPQFLVLNPWAAVLRIQNSSYF